MPQQTKIALRIPVVASDRVQGNITGWAALSTDDNGAPVFDHEDHWVPVDELEKACHEAFKKGLGVDGLGDMHERVGVGDVVESFVIDGHKRAALGFGDGPHGWVITAHVTDPDVLADVLSGEKPELSFRGWGRANPIGNGKFRISDLRLNTAELVSVVDAGASGNDRVSPRVVLIKRAERAQKKASDMTPEERAAKLEQLRAKLGDELYADMLAMIELAATPAAASEPAEPMDKADPEKKPDEMAKADDKADDELKKRLKKSPEFADAFARVEAQNVELSKRLVTVQREVKEREALDKVRQEYAHVPGAEHATVARIMQRSQEALEPDTYVELCKILKASSDAVEQSELLRSSGSGGSVDTGGYGKLSELAKRRAAEQGISYGNAYQAVARENPDLYRQAR